MEEIYKTDHLLNTEPNDSESDDSVLMDKIDQYELKIKDLEYTIDSKKDEIIMLNEKVEFIQQEQTAKDEEIKRINENSEALQNRLNYFIEEKFEEKLKEKNDEIDALEKLIYDLKEKNQEEVDKLKKTLEEVNSDSQGAVMLREEVGTLNKKLSAKVEENNRLRKDIQEGQKSDINVLEMKNKLRIYKSGSEKLHEEVKKLKEKEIKLEDELNTYKQETTDLNDRIKELEIQKNFMEDKVNDLEFRKKGNNENSFQDLAYLGQEMDEYFDEFEKETQEDAKKIQEATVLKGEDIERLEKTIENLKKGHEKYKTSLKQNHHKMLTRIESLTNQNSEMSAELSKIRSNKNSIESKLQRSQMQVKVLEDDVKKLIESQQNQPKDPSSIAGEMLSKVLKLEKEANMFKFKSERLSQDLIKSKAESNQHVNIMYSIIFDMVCENNLEAGVIE